MKPLMGDSPCEARAANEAKPSSLDPIELNRYTTVHEELQKRGRRKTCGVHSLRGRSPDSETELIVRLNCKSWDCAFCGARKAARYKRRIREVAEQEGLNRFLTLTLDPRKIEGDPVCYLRSVFAKFRVYLLRTYGKGKKAIKFIAVLEFHKNGVPHLHVLLGRFIKQQWISQCWSALGGGRIVDIRYVDVHRISRYLAKYLTKELLMSAPQRCRRVTCSRSIHLNEKQSTETNWVMEKRSIFLLYEVFRAVAARVVLDHEGFICSFLVPAGMETPFLE